jgi:hypothetical protein
VLLGFHSTDIENRQGSWNRQIGPYCVRGTFSYSRDARNPSVFFPPIDRLSDAQKNPALVSRWADIRLVLTISLREHCYCVRVAFISRLADAYLSEESIAGCLKGAIEGSIRGGLIARNRNGRS